MSNYIPKFENPASNLIILDSVFDADDVLEYATKHRFDVKFTETAASITLEIMMKFKKSGFEIDLAEEPNIAPDGTKLIPKIVMQKYAFIFKYTTF